MALRKIIDVMEPNPWTPTNTPAHQPHTHDNKQHTAHTLSLLRPFLTHPLPGGRQSVWGNEVFSVKGTVIKLAPTTHARGNIHTDKTKLYTFLL